MITFLSNVASQFTFQSLAAIALATGVGVGIGLIYYALLQEAWRNAVSMTAESARALRSWSTFGIAGICYALLAFALFGVTWHASQGQVTLRSSLIAASLAWLGFIASTMTANHRFHGRPWILTVINTTHWLLVIYAQGTVIGLVA